MENNNNFTSYTSNIKVRLNIFRILIYILEYGIFGVAVFLFFRSYTCFLFLIVFFILPFISVFMLKAMISKIDLMLYASEAQIQVLQDIGIGINVKNSSILSSLKCKCYLSIKNLYYGDEISQIFTIPVLARSSNKNPLYCKVTNCGIVEVTLEKCEIMDIMGFAQAKLIPSQTVSISVLPNDKPLDDIQKIGILSGYTDNEDDKQKGNEYSDTSNIREYIAGDRIKDIHWKLSAKKDQLLVRDRIKSCENKIVIWIEPSRRKKYCEQILSLTYSVINFCLKENTLVKIMWYDKSSDSINERTINNRNELIFAFNAIYRSGRFITPVNFKELLLANNYALGNILRIGTNGSLVELTSYEI